MSTSYVPEEWAIARRPSGGWVLLGALPAASEGQYYRVVWPVSPDKQALVEEYGQEVWSQSEFAPVVEAISRIIDGIQAAGEYKSVPAFDLAAWVTSYEAGE